MRNRLSINKMDMLCFIYINSWSICTATKQKDEEAERLAVLIVDLLLNQEDDLVECEAINDDDEDEWEDLEAFFDEVINSAPT
jgi:hypothetical protein